MNPAILEQAFSVAFVMSILSAFQSIILFFIPRFAELSARDKQLVNIGLILLISAGTFGLSCFGVVDAISCDPDGILETITVFVGAVTGGVVGNSAMYTAVNRAIEG